MINNNIQVDFYILQKQRAAEMWLFACRFLEKAYKLKHTVFVHLANAADAAKLDQLLWTFNDISFIPHALSHEPEVSAVPVILSVQDTPELIQDIYVNLTAEITKATVPRIVEIVADEEPFLTQSRQKYLKYRDLGFDIKTHKL